MEKEKIEKIKKGVECCGNNSPCANCYGCPYKVNRDEIIPCTVRLLSDCGEYIRELTGASV